MNAEILLDLIFMTAVVLVSLLILLIPIRVLGTLTVPFSLKTFGIRKIKRWHSRTDTPANIMIWISIIFSFAAPWIPWAPVIFGFLLTITWLCALSRAVRLTAVKNHWKKLTVVFCINLLYGTGLVSGLGCMNYYSLWIRSFLFANELLAGHGSDFMYYLTSPQAAAWVLQSLLMMVPLVSLWGQFKYMRLENTFKSRFLTTYIIKSFVLVILLAGAGAFGQKALEWVYQVPSESRVSSSNTFHPLSRQEMIADDIENVEEVEHENQESVQIPEQSVQNDGVDPSTSDPEPQSVPDDNNQTETVTP